MRVWKEAVRKAILRHVGQTGSPIFTRRAFFAAEEEAMAAEVQTVGLTPKQTATRELQHLREDGLVEFLAPGTYRWRGDMPDAAPSIPTNGVFGLGDGVEPEKRYVFSSEWLATARRMVGEWIIYHDGTGYRSAAKVIRIASDREGFFRAEIEDRSYLELGRSVPLIWNGEVIERGLTNSAGELDHILASTPVRAISRGDFDRILNLGLVTDEDLLPREDVEDELAASSLHEERAPWAGPVDRTVMLASRKVRDRQFRKRVLDAYGATCALTGQNWINGGGRAETQAAHIMSVEVGGPDRVTNGIALSGTFHWMFDRGLISLDDTGEILLSRAINDRERVEGMIHPNRMARLPAAAKDHPDPRYLHWHRTECFHH